MEITVSMTLPMQMIFTAGQNFLAKLIIQMLLLLELQLSDMNWKIKYLSLIGFFLRKAV